MSEPIESIEAPVEITDESIAEFVEASTPDAPSYHPILEVWRAILQPAADEARKKVTAAFANRIVASYAGIEYGDMNEYRDRYFAKVLQLADVLDLEIASDPDCLRPTTPEDDVEVNSGHYKNLLLQWQLCLVQWEKDWDTTDPYAAVEIATISEVHKMFFGETGLTAFLDNIKFEFDDLDQAQLAEALQELKDAPEVDGE